MKRKRGFFVFCFLTVLLVACCIWVLSSSSDEAETAPVSQSANTAVVLEAEIQPARVSLEQKLMPSGAVPKQPAEFDATLLVESLEKGATPTQDVGEKGSLEGKLATNTPMKYAESKYQKLPDSPLVVFTDDMIWRDGEDSFSAKKDALADQARHIQEASIALSVSPRVEMGKTTGYRLVEIPENTLFAKMGMVSGDIVVSINGTMPDMEPMALMFVNMAAGMQGVSTVVVDHRGKERTIHLKAVE